MNIKINLDILKEFLKLKLTELGGLIAIIAGIFIGLDILFVAVQWISGSWADEVITGLFIRYPAFVILLYKIVIVCVIALLLYIWLKKNWEEAKRRIDF